MYKCTESKNIYKVGGVEGCTSCTNVQKEKNIYKVGGVRVVQFVLIYKK